MNPWIPHLLRASGGGGGPVLPPTGRTMLANLTSSLILDEGTGGPTWSRATKAWRFNELGYLEELASGCAAFGGARLIRNTVRTTSEDFSNAAWVKTDCTVTGTNTIICSNTTLPQRISQESSYSSSPTRTVGNVIQFSVRIRRVSGGVSFLQLSGQGASFGTGQYANFSLIDGSVSAIGCTATSTLVSGTTDTYDFSIRCIATAAAAYDVFNVIFINSITDARLPNFTGDGIKSFECLRACSVDVTGYDASYIPEYVSVGIVSTPFFGAGIDGAKYFETDWQGAPIAAANLLGFRREASATNNLLHSRDLTNKAWQVLTASGSELLANGTFDADITGWSNYNGSISSWSAGAISVVYSATNSGPYALFTTTVGKSYTVSAELISATGYTANNVLRAGNGVLPDPGLSDSAVFTAPGTKTISFVATGTTSWVYLRSSDGVTVVWDNVTAKESSVQPTKTATGLDGIANTATTLTFTAADAIILQPISLASAVRCASAYVKRRTGTGTISFTQDGGSTWTDITSQINSSTWSRVQITSTLANPSVGFKGGTPNDQVDVGCVQNEAGAVATSLVVTTTAAVSRNADSDTYQTASNWSDTAGTAYIEAQPWQWSSGGLLGSATNGLLESASNSGATAYDGTNAANGPTGTPSGRKKLALRWTGATMDVSVGGVIGTAGTYDGAMGLASLGIAVDSSGYFGPAAVWNYAMTDDEFKALTT